MHLKIEKLITTLEESFSGTPWLGSSLLGKLKTLNHTVVNHTQGNAQNSIATITHHILNWRVFVLEKLRENEAYDIEMNSEQDWTPITIENAEEWEGLLKKLIDNQNELIQILKEKDDTFIASTTLARTYSLEYLVEGLIQHDLYHAGQIGLLYAQLT